MRWCVVKVVKVQSRNGVVEDAIHSMTFIPRVRLAWLGPFWKA